MTTGSADRATIIGAGRAGGSFAAALEGVGWQVELRHHGDDLHDAAAGVALVLICVPDGSIATVAASVEPHQGAVVAHCAGSLGPAVLGPALHGTHAHRATLHPLVSLPSPEVGADRLRGAWYGIAGDPTALRLVERVVEQLGGRGVVVADEDRAAYHAAAVVASNHLVALLGQVERIAAGVGVPLEAFLALAAGSLDNVAALGPAAALTGPVARGDWTTVQRHLDALDPAERDAYLALVAAAARLAARDVPELER